MVTTDSSLIPALVFPDSATGNVTLHMYDSTILIKPVLKWKKVAGATGYRIVVAANPRFAPTIIDDATLSTADTSKSLSGVSLSYSTPYYWAVQAISNGGKVGWSRVWLFTTKADPVFQLQKDYVAQKFGMFIHFSMATFARNQYPDPQGEWELGGENENLFQPDSLDLGKWADVAKSAHCKYAVVTTKHHGGFCLWPSKGPWTANHPHSIVQSTWYAAHGNRDILREFVDSMRSRNVEPGFYFSIWDRTNAANIALVKGELTELLSNYGDIKVIWFDGWGWKVGYRVIPYDTVAALVHKLNDSLGHHTIISENNHKFQLYNTELAQYEIPLDGPPISGNTIPAEGNEPIRGDNSWFWHPMNAEIKGTSFILDRIRAANAVNATYLLDVTPDTLGMIPGDQVQRMKEIGDAAVQQGILP
jgi:alpha-L-fucosidase